MAKVLVTITRVGPHTHDREFKSLEFTSCVFDCHYDPAPPSQSFELTLPASSLVANCRGAVAPPETKVTSKAESSVSSESMRETFAPPNSNSSSRSLMSNQSDACDATQRNAGPDAHLFAGFIEAETEPITPNESVP